MAPREIAGAHLFVLIEFPKGIAPSLRRSVHQGSHFLEVAIDPSRKAWIVKSSRADD
jgi:hypothetical protein